MIIKMKRITILGLKSHTDEIIEQLRGAGVLHVTHINPPEGPLLEKVADKIYLSQLAIEKLPETKENGSEPPDVMKAVDQIVEASERLDVCEDELGNLEQEQKRIAFLGDFNREDIAYLEKRGIFITLYKFTHKNKNNSILLKKFPSVYLGGSDGKELVAVVVSYRERVELDMEEFVLPQVSPFRIQKQIESKRAQREQIAGQLSGYSKYHKSIERNLLDLKSTRDFEQVRSGVGSAEDVVYLRGYCPVDKVPEMRAYARKNAWGFLIEDPSAFEEPPTLVKNPRWVQIISPVFTLLNTLPGYRELDISAVFLIFFTIFFGMIIGDAGYGILFLAGTAFVHKKTGKKVKRKDMFYLMYVLSTTTIIWGGVTGNWFGVEYLTRIEPFSSLIVQGLNAYTLEAQDVVMRISFYIAAVHLSLAHIMVMIKDLRLTNVLANAGWVMMVWVMFFIAQNQVLGASLPWFFLLLLITSGLFIVVFSLLGRRPGKGMAELLIADIILATINTFADTISYIRLFAVGLATLAVAQSFNSIAQQTGFGNVLSSFGSALILVGGHALNIALAAMAVIVHGVRLNMLEFSGHVGNTWSGYSYDPFRNKQIAERVHKLSGGKG